MKLNSDTIAIYGYYFLFAIVIALGIWWEVSAWSECRETNSFWYCLRILGK